MKHAARERASTLLATALIFWFRLRLRLPRGLGRGRLLRHATLAATTGRRWPLLAAGPATQLLRLFARAQEAGGAACLARSLALARFLRLHGLHARVCLGFARGAGRLAGHAWVEHDCSVVGDDAAFVARFSRLRPVGLGGKGA